MDDIEPNSKMRKITPEIRLIIYKERLPYALKFHGTFYIRKFT